MLIYGNSFFIEDNGNGYAIEERDAICTNCGNIVDRQVKYVSIDKQFPFSDIKKVLWKNCPYCGEKLY